MMIRMRDVELSDQSHQERLHLNDPIQRAALSVPRRVKSIEYDQRTRIATQGSS